MLHVSNFRLSLLSHSSITVSNRCVPILFELYFLVILLSYSFIESLGIVLSFSTMTSNFRILALVLPKTFKMQNIYCARKNHTDQKYMNTKKVSLLKKDSIITKDTITAIEEKRHANVKSINMKNNILACKIDLAEHCLNLKHLECEYVIKIMDFVCILHKRLLHACVDLEILQE